ncbi:MAG: 16S rRNA (cytosine(967)-C(5))-methyltransferase RsmB [Acidobacteria bacterium]|nr:MAG: 16S rRNA (cytosine(967)-C(5))-methyltransferase RsmB [Acidobacteriota bacterium]REK01297.1 MAG: 16S rRNA (cytosine(967)-C(5))-methyltransferase RsmB [Acidobacteriota bacterium]REK14253.1 MAG: 16S rRNA (cytosine(967)-C(5))-methyltransferase RsmB [Acidobacteriota bacterium]REK44968.1 MAG: 16S rRNA (cytosine(967)-C(5))-methyltransferase RsmB [Acidobacteriota bacterium]
MPISPSRTAAFDILLAVENESKDSSSLLAERADELDEKDRGLCHEIVLGTLRRQMFLDAVLNSHSKKPLSKLDTEVLVSLRMGLYQLRYLDRIPDHAAVSDSVSLAVRAGKRSAKGFVNGILRSAIRSRTDLGFVDEIEELAVRESHPRWLVERWIGRFGIANTRSLLAFNNRAPSSEFRFTRKFDQLDGKEQERISRVISALAVRSDLADGSFRAVSADNYLRKAFQSGLIYYQDQGSKVVADSIDTQPADKVLDLCAAPGSKTTQIARKVDPLAGSVTACDVSERRIQVLEENCLRQGAEFVSFVRLNAESRLPFANSSFDKVLVDAPCTGTGTIAQNPEIRYRVRPEDLPLMAAKQLSILENASKTVKPGGTLIYSTCSLEGEENDSVAEEFLGNNDEYEVEGLRLPQVLSNGKSGVSLTPQEHSTSGFFIAGFRRLR